jgi:hypothetical protein
MVKEFSQRMGIYPEQAIQISSISEELRSSLWNMIYLHYFEDRIYKDLHWKNIQNIFYFCWKYYFKKPVDTIAIDNQKSLQILRDYFFHCPWNEVYDFIQFCFVLDNSFHITTLSPEGLNIVLQTENSGYRFIDGKIVPITSTEEIDEINNAIDNKNLIDGGKEHLRTALTLMSDREKPDYRNSIKESISAVESMCKHITGEDKGVLGQLLKKIEKSGELHPAFTKAFSNLYGWTNDEGGIRHAMLDEKNHTLADARFRLIACSAFVNYVLDKTNSTS